jgi:hypothetical protein
MNGANGGMKMAAACGLGTVESHVVVRNYELGRLPRSAVRTVPDRLGVNDGRSQSFSSDAHKLNYRV